MKKHVAERRTPQTQRGDCSVPNIVSRDLGPRRERVPPFGELNTKGRKLSSIESPVTVSVVENRKQALLHEFCFIL